MHRSLISAVIGLCALTTAATACGSDGTVTTVTTTTRVATPVTTVHAASTQPAATAAAPTTAAGPTSAVATTAAGAPSRSLQQQVSKLTVEFATKLGYVADVDCVDRLAAQLSDADAKQLIDTYPDGDPQLSDAGKATGAQLAACYSGGPTGSSEPTTTTG